MRIRAYPASLASVVENCVIGALDAADDLAKNPAMHDNSEQGTICVAVIRSDEQLFDVLNTLARLRKIPTTPDRGLVA